MTSATFSCDAGYSLHGSPTLTCSTSGLWSDNLPVCGKRVDNADRTLNMLNVKLK